MLANNMLIALSEIWKGCMINYPEANHEKILEYIQKLQSIIFELEDKQKSKK